jgi:succinate dehydrogenase/fumarate reductase flavoprotein subunit
MGRVAIIGGGMAGLCAGIAVAEAGGEAVVLESESRPGGSAAISGGLIWGPRDLAVARSRIPRGDPDLQRLHADGLDAAWDWLGEHGLPLDEERPCLKEQFGRGRLMGLGRAGDRAAFTDAMAARGAELGVELRTAARVETAEREGDELVLTLAGGAEVRAAAVIFAAGGFHLAPDLLSRWVTTDPAALVIRSNHASDGVAIRLGTALGAELSAGLHSFYGHTLPDIPGKDWSSVDELLGASMFFTDYCVLVNRLGLRFADESYGSIDEYNAQAGCRQPGGRYFVIFDEGLRRDRVDADVVGIPGLSVTRQVERLATIEALGADVQRADTIAGLAARMERAWDVPAEAVADTVRSYNERPAALEPPRRRDHSPLTEAPFFAIRCVAGITYTMGGLAVGTGMEVAGAGPGVFAAGADAGNVFEDAYGGGLAWAIVSGRVAGAAAATVARQAGVAA